MALGQYPNLGLAAARFEREKAKVQLQAGRDPGAKAEAPVRPPCRTLREAAQEWLTVAGAEWKTSHREPVESRLRRNVLPALAEIEGDLWRMPSERMKVEGIEHLVPLPPQMRKLLAQVREIGGGSPWIFPGEKGQPMSQNTMIFGLYRLEWHSRATIHGLRRTFSTWANEQGKWNADAIERQLAHWERDEVRGAYNAAEYLPARREMMVEWNKWLV